MPTQNILVVSLLAALTGCSSVSSFVDGLKEPTSNHDDQLVQPQDIEGSVPGNQPSVSPNRRDAVVITHNGKRGGAALRPEERQHVLYWSAPIAALDEVGASLPVEAVNTVTSVSDEDLLAQSLETLKKIDTSKEPPSSSDKPPSSQANLLDSSAPSSASKPNSNGVKLSYYELSRWERYCKGLPDKLDVAFIVKHGGHDAVPQHLAGNCSPLEKL